MGGPMILTFFAPGVPAPQGSKRIGRNRRTGRAILIESSEAVKPWRAAVAAAALEARNLARSAVRSGPMAVVLEFVMPRPKRVTRPACDVKPDVDKLQRSTLDALSGVLFHDDAQVVKITASKRYARASGIENPGALITVEAITDPGVSIGERVPAMDTTGGIG